MLSSQGSRRFARLPCFPHIWPLSCHPGRHILSCFVHYCRPYSQHSDLHYAFQGCQALPAYENMAKPIESNRLDLLAFAAERVEADARHVDVCASSAHKRSRQATARLAHVDDDALQPLTKRSSIGGMPIAAICRNAAAAEAAWPLRQARNSLELPTPPLRPDSDHRPNDQPHQQQQASHGEYGPLPIPTQPKTNSTISAAPITPRRISADALGCAPTSTPSWALSGTTPPATPARFATTPTCSNGASNHTNTHAPNFPLQHLSGRQLPSSTHNHAGASPPVSGPSTPYTLSATEPGPEPLRQVSGVRHLLQQLVLLHTSCSSPPLRPAAAANATPAPAPPSAFATAPRQQLRQPLSHYQPVSVPLSVPAHVAGLRDSLSVEAPASPAWDAVGLLASRSSVGAAPADGVRPMEMQAATATANEGPFARLPQSQLQLLLKLQEQANANGAARASHTGGRSHSVSHGTSAGGEAAAEAPGEVSQGSPSAHSSHRTSDPSDSALPHAPLSAPYPATWTDGSAPTARVWHPGYAPAHPHSRQPHAAVRVYPYPHSHPYPPPPHAWRRVPGAAPRVAAPPAGTWHVPYGAVGPVPAGPNARCFRSSTGGAPPGNDFPKTTARCYYPMGPEAAPCGCCDGAACAVRSAAAQRAAAAQQLARRASDDPEPGVAQADGPLVGVERRSPAVPYGYTPVALPVPVPVPRARWAVPLEGRLASSWSVSSEPGFERAPLSPQGQQLRGAEPAGAAAAADGSPVFAPYPRIVRRRVVAGYGAGGVRPAAAVLGGRPDGSDGGTLPLQLQLQLPTYATRTVQRQPAGGLEGHEGGAAAAAGSGGVKPRRYSYSYGTVPYGVGAVPYTPAVYPAAGAPATASALPLRMLGPGAEDSL